MHHFVSSAIFGRTIRTLSAVVRLSLSVLRHVMHAPTAFVDAIEKIAIKH